MSSLNAGKLSVVKIFKDISCLEDTKIDGLVLMKTRPKVIAAIPAYNEERFIGEVVYQARDYVDHVIVIDDGSTDQTANIAWKLGALVIRHKFNQGKGKAINTAFNIARKLGAEILVLLDGDLQHNPKEIPSLIQALKENQADMAVGSRFLNKNKIPRYRRLGQEILNLTTNICSGIKLTDTQSGFRAFSKKAINVLNFTEVGLSVESEMQFLAKKKELSITEIPITTNYTNNVKRNPAVHGLGVLFRILYLKRKYLLNI